MGAAPGQEDDGGRSATTRTTAQRLSRMTAQRLSLLVSDGDLAAVRTAVQEQPQLLSVAVERDGADGWTPLHLAVAAGHAPIVTALVEAGADPTARTEDGRTPLHLALAHTPHLVEVLRELGAPVDAASAAFLGDVQTLSRALDDGAPLTDPDTDADLLSWAAAGGRRDAVELLLRRGAAPGPALHAAAAAGAPTVVQALLDAGADVDRRDEATGRTALHAAVTGSGHDAAAGPGHDAPAVVRLLLEAGADVDATTHDGASALDIARVAAARQRAAATGDAPEADALVEMLVTAGATG
ncbi:ankyrin repeat domain-containing protein [Modestobacter sp. VKM Ac-2985]|uniref:ankyrin repeat domain-containing protein n=1 Tax=Modestobacter sp. VKM Ac-2985 TaxID=3004139 RepID=UPI0022ABA7B3|nr:ankyrin repeat domain-containing protein [Modestobacter sp. VKM Ac-2985]MCZ2838744.1 ankyrin repeat domain-containing protein [Modestobacter sp. VKM Ac-2985]